MHPFFYSRNIKRFTDCLVYIPYYETGGEQAESLQLLPAYFSSDFIIAQSMEHKRQFDKQFFKKILVLGSPKIDRIMNLQINDENIPREWRGKLCKDVFFYNTSISGLLKDSCLAIEKMKYVFEIFRGEHATLIWRPHPLLESTIKAMCPEVLSQYEEAVNDFATLKYGILDKTPDAGIAIKLSDAYIGEETSSMVHLFGVLGKPILISNLAINEDFTKESGNSPFFCVVEEGDEIWAVAGDRNGLIRYEKSSGKVENYRIPNEKPDGQRLYNTMVSYKDMLYLIPCNAAEIAVFNKDAKEFIKIPFDNPCYSSFIKAHVYNENVYMIPSRYPAILQLDCATNKITYINMTWSKKLLHDPGEPFSFNGSMMVGSVILVALTFDNLVLTIDLSNRNMEIIDFNSRCGENAKGFWCMAGDGERIILGSNTGRRLFYWNRTTNDCRILEPYPKDWTGDDKCFFEMVYLNGYVYVFPKTGNQILKINLESLEIESAEDDVREPENMNLRKNQYYSLATNTLFAQRFRGHILFQRAFDYKIYEISEKETRSFQINLSQVMTNENMAENFCRRGKNLPWVMKETRINSIRHFVKYVQSRVHDQSKQRREYYAIAENIDGTAGEKIYRSVLKYGVDG